MHTFDQIRAHRRAWSWLPDFVFSDHDFIPGINIIDTFHIMKGASFWMMALGGALYVFSGKPLWSLETVGWFVAAWVLKGQVFDLFYHFIWMKPEFRDHLILNRGSRKSLREKS